MARGCRLFYGNVYKIYNATFCAIAELTFIVLISLT